MISSIPLFFSLILIAPEIIKIPYSSTFDIIHSNTVIDILKCSLIAIVQKIEYNLISHTQCNPISLYGGFHLSICIKNTDAKLILQDVCMSFAKLTFKTPGLL